MSRAQPHSSSYQQLLVVTTLEHSVSYNTTATTQHFLRESDTVIMYLLQFIKCMNVCVIIVSYTVHDE